MMNRAVGEFDRAKGRMANDLRAMITDSEDLLKAAATVSGEGFTAARSRFEDKLKSVEATLADASAPAIRRARESAAYADDYVHGNAWAIAGVAIAAGVLLGYLFAKR